MSDIEKNEDRDVVVFQDEDGSEIELDVIDYFVHEDQEYAVLMDLNALPEEGESGQEDQDVFIMKVITEGDTEEFLPVDDDMMEALSAIVEERLFGDEEEE